MVYSGIFFHVLSISSDRQRMQTGLEDSRRVELLCKLRRGYVYTIVSSSIRYRRVSVRPVASKLVAREQFLLLFCDLIESDEGALGQEPSLACPPSKGNTIPRVPL